MRLMIRDCDDIKAVVVKKDYFWILRNKFVESFGSKELKDFQKDYPNPDTYPCNKVLELQFEDYGGETRAQIVGFVLDNGEVINPSQADGYFANNKHHLLEISRINRDIAYAPLPDEYIARYSLFIKNTKTNELEYHSFYTFGEMNAYLRVNENAEFDKIFNYTYMNCNHATIDLKGDRIAVVDVKELLDCGENRESYNRFVVDKPYSSYKGLKYNGKDYECSNVLEYRVDYYPKDKNKDLGSITSEVIGFITNDGQIIDPKDPLFEGIYYQPYEDFEKKLYTDLNKITSEFVISNTTIAYGKNIYRVNEYPEKKDLLRPHIVINGSKTTLYDTQKTMKEEYRFDYSPEEFPSKAKEIPFEFELTPKLDDEDLLRLEFAYIAEYYKSDNMIDDFIDTYYYGNAGFEELSKQDIDNIEENKKLLFDRFREEVNAHAVGVSNFYENAWGIAADLVYDLLDELKEKKEKEKQNEQNQKQEEYNQVRKNR